MKANISLKRGRFVATLSLMAIAAWLVLHVTRAINAEDIMEHIYSNWVFIFSFIILSVAVALAYYEKPYKLKNKSPKKYFATVVVPTYNEDPDALRDCLRSLVEQSRKPQEVFVVDDGSNAANYDEVYTWFKIITKKNRIKLTWVEKKNGGKRKAQSTAFMLANKAEVFITVDSDSVLDYHAIEELLKPFENPKIQSVAGIVLARNNRVNLLARITDLMFVTGQLIDRSMMSKLGSVLVNSGALAAYRADVIRDNLDAYLNESFFGRHIEFSDDSMLTLYALQKGKTIQQPTAFAFTMMPDRVSHHLRQQIRWMRGSFIRSWWRIKYLPVKSFGFARQAIGWSQFAMASVFFLLIIVASPALHISVILNAILVSILIGYAQTLRYLSVSRSDQSFGSQLLTYSLTPLMVVWLFFVIKPLRIYSTVTCFNGKWGTRKKIEVKVNGKIDNTQTLKFSRLYLNIETNYEYLGRSIRASGLTYDEALNFWHNHYNNLSEQGRRDLWRDYRKVQKRNQKQLIKANKRLNLILRTPIKPIIIRPNEPSLV